MTVDNIDVDKTILQVEALLAQEKNISPALTLIVVRSLLDATGRWGVETRQVMEIDFATFVTEYQAQILEDSSGQRFVAEFPQGVSRPIQYGPRLKAQAVYLSQFQLIPYNRIQDYVDPIQPPTGLLCRSAGYSLKYRVAG